MRQLENVEIRNIIPHRFPFLFVDRVLELVRDSYAVAVKNVTANEPHFQGHFPNRPIFPGVLILEAMAQVGGIALLGEGDHSHDLVTFLAGVDNARFRRPVVPGDVLTMRANVVRHRSRFAKVEATAHVDGDLAVSADITYVLEKAEE